jgi:hypothetical protein
MELNPKIIEAARACIAARIADWEAERTLAHLLRGDIDELGSKIDEASSRVVMPALGYVPMSDVWDLLRSLGISGGTP